jgi:hypothetical protein
MVIRLLAEARGAYRKAFLDNMLSASNGTIELALHFGDRKSDFDVPNFIRQRATSAVSGNHFKKTIYKGANLPLISSEWFHFSAERFADQIHRSSWKHQKKSHKMINLHEYIDYYHILSDVIANEIVKRKITHAVFFDIPHLGLDTLIYDVARSMGIQTLILTQFFPDKIFSMESIEDFGEFQLNYNEAIKYPLASDGVSDLYYMDKSWQEITKRGSLNFWHIMNLMVYFLLNSPKSAFNYKMFSSTVKRLRNTVESLPEWRDPFKKLFDPNQLEYLEFLSGYEGKIVNFEIPYIYVPLHLQPEMTTSSLGGIYRDQLLMIEHLHRILPSGWRILVKENPKQSFFARGAMFFHRLNRLQNVEMVPSDTNSEKLIKSSQIVATVTGTAGWEAVQIGKPVITFGYAWYNKVAGVHRFHPEINLQSISKQKSDLDLVSKSAGALFQRAHLGNIDKGFFEHAKDFDKIDNAKIVGVLLNDILNGKIQRSFGR